MLRMNMRLRVVDYQPRANFVQQLLLFLIFKTLVWPPGTFTLSNLALLKRNLDTPDLIYLSRYPILTVT